MLLPHPYDHIQTLTTLSLPTTKPPSMASTTPPMEIITDILLRLPIKDILRSKSVAKAWYNLITSPHFVKLHLHRTPPLPSDRTMVLASPDSLQIANIDSLNRLYKLDFPQTLSPHAFLIGTSNGLISVYSRKRFTIALINPATRKSRVISQADLPPDPRATICFGFGYDRANDDYKVVMVTSRLVVRGARESHEFQRGIRVYSMKTNSWRSLSEEVSDEEIGSRGAVANGRMHWVSIKPGREGKSRIVSFDIEEERLGEAPIPPYYGGQVHHPKEVAEMDGKLCFLTEANRGGMLVYIDVWMMKEYGNENSWNKLYSVWCLSPPYPVVSSRNGNEVLYCEDGTLYWFNRYEQKKDVTELRGVEAFTEAVVCVGSLVPVSLT